MMTSRRSKSDRVADSRSRSISLLMMASFSMNSRSPVYAFRLVVVVADEELDGVLREEPAELLIELAASVLLHHHQRRPVHARQDLRHRERLPESVTLSNTCDFRRGADPQSVGRWRADPGRSKPLRGSNGDRAHEGTA
jgi:hypothetical protein